MKPRSWWARIRLPVSETYPDLVDVIDGAAEGVNIPVPERRAPDRYYPQVETERDVYVRAVRVLREIVRQYPGGAHHCGEPREPDSPRYFGGAGVRAYADCAER